MIKKSIIFTIFLLICWGGFIKYKPFSLSQHQWQNNIIRAEKFTYDIDSVDNLIVGSSLAKRLNMDSLQCFYNLSFVGQSIFDGLKMLRNKNPLPKNVFIETNVIMRGENTNFNEIMSSPILNTLKENSSIFRAGKQPLVYASRKFIFPLISAFFHQFIYRVRNKINLEFQPDKLINSSGSNSSIFDKMLTLQIDSYSKNIDTSMMNTRFKSLKNHVRFLESKNVQVFFFEMPVNPQLVELKRAKYLRSRIKREFPGNDYLELPENIEIYKTTDGLHLTSEESRKYTDYFKNEIITITNGFY